MMDAEGLRIGIVGATGAVGSQILTVLPESDLTIKTLVPMASQRSAGDTVEAAGDTLEVQAAAPEHFDTLDVVFIAAGTGVSREMAPAAAAEGAVVIDKSNAFRMDDAVPLVVPEVNMEAAEGHDGIIASPNCSTIQMVLPLEVLQRLSPLRRVTVSTYQSVSGSGAAAVEELHEQSRDVLDGRSSEPQVYPHPVAFNALPHIGDVLDDGYTREEMKLVHETRKIMDLPELQLTATAVRIPVFVGHGESVLVETDSPVPVPRLRQELEAAPGITVLDDAAAGEYPLPQTAAGQDDVFVGRIRRDLSSEAGIWLWIVSDNLRKGAATNAVQIVEGLQQRDWLHRG